MYSPLKGVIVLYNFECAKVLLHKSPDDGNGKRRNTLPQDRMVSDTGTLSSADGRRRGGWRSRRPVRERAVKSLSVLEATTPAVLPRLGTGGVARNIVPAVRVVDAPRPLPRPKRGCRPFFRPCYPG